MAVCESRTGCTNIALPKLVLEIMPSGRFRLKLIRLYDVLVELRENVKGYANLFQKLLSNLFLAL